MGREMVQYLLTQTQTISNTSAVVALRYDGLFGHIRGGEGPRAERNLHISHTVAIAQDLGLGFK